MHRLQVHRPRHRISQKHQLLWIKSISPQNNISVTLSLPGATAVKSLSTNQTTKGKEVYYTLNGLKVDELI